MTIVYTTATMYIQIMAKKYLLYIHDERFEKESHKSGLINKLLTDYYSGPIRILTPKPLKTPLGDKGKYTGGEFNAIHFCKHDAVRGLCKKGCK